MSADAYFEQAVATIRGIAESQREAIGEAAEVLVGAVTGDRTIFSFGASHSFMITEELVYRTGGLMLVNPIYPHGMNLAVRPLTLTSQLERVHGLGRELFVGSGACAGDVLLITSTSGRNAVTVDMALAARDAGVRTIGITSLAYTSEVSSRHESGAKLVDVCDLVLDNGAPAGDSAVTVPGFPQAVGPLSTVTGCALVNALAAEVVSRLVAAGVTPPVFMSANIDGGDAHNAELLAANAHRIHYMH
jgi:uncharacterized phosphosugar-binding protein